MILCGVSNVFHAVLQNLKLCVCVCVCVYCMPFRKSVLHLYLKNWFFFPRLCPSSEYACCPRQCKQCGILSGRLEGCEQVVHGSWSVILCTRMVHVTPRLVGSVFITCPQSLAFRLTNIYNTGNILGNKIMFTKEFIHNDTNTTLHFSHSGNVSKLYLGLQSQYPSLSLIRLFCAG